MADKKYIRDLNSLIRFNPRKRLKTPPRRNEIKGGRGQAELGATEPFEAVQNMYINHASPVGAYEYLNDGTAPTLFGGMGDNGGLGIVGTDVYSSSVTNGNVYKNGSFHFSGVGSFSRVAANSTKLAVDNGDYTVSLYDHDGTFDNTFSLPNTFATSGVPFCANDAGVGYIHDQALGVTQMMMSDYSGVELGRLTFNDIGNSDMCAASKHCFVFVDRDFGSDEKRIKVFNTAGTLIGTHVLTETTLEIALGGQLDAIGITENEIYLVGWNSGAIPNVLIYDLTLTIDGSGLATASALGALKATVAAPGISGALRSQYCVINAELMA